MSTARAPATAASLYEQATVAATRTPPGSAPPAFSDGEVVAGRYRIVGFLAQGGMGEVWEAEDLELRQRVALKTISARAGQADPDPVERFKREIALARIVTHPNVCRIFDLGQHQPAAREPGAATPPAVTFLTMELLAGETLSHCLHRRGRLSTAEALPLVEQMAAALDAAHSAGVIHRDFKSENVFLVPQAGAAEVGRPAKRVVVTDFGIARGGADDRFAVQVTGAGIVGTPAYMAPEQVGEGAITPATDVYALGIVLYEMVTGRLPFKSENPLSTAVKRLTEPPPPPHVHAPDLEAWWEKAILRCLEIDPARRFASATEVAEALQPRGRRPPGGRPAPRTEEAPAAPAPRAAAPPMATAGAVTRQPPLRSVVLALVLVLVTAASAALFYFNRDRRIDRSRITPRRSVAVLGFKNLSGGADVAWLGTALAEMLTTELARGEALRTIPGDNVALLERQLSIDAAASIGTDDLGRVRSLLGCDFLVSGSYVALGEAGRREVRLDLRLQDAALGSTLASLARAGGEEELFAMVSELGGELRHHLGVGEAGGADDPMAGLPKDPEAARLYSEALDKLRASEPRAARELLEEAARQAPRNALVHSALSQAWEDEGYGARAAESAARAFELSSPLPREDRLAVEGRYREATGDWPAATEVYRDLWDYFPDDLEYGLRLVAAQVAGRDPEGALATLDDLRRLPAPISEDPRIDLAEAAAAGLASDFARQLTAAQRAAERAARIDAPLLDAQARLAEAQAFRVLGRLDEAEAAAGAGFELYDRLGHPAGSAEAATVLANIRFDRGELDEAAAGYRRVIDEYRRLGDQDGTASGLKNLALVLRRRGDLDGAQVLYEQAAEIFAATGDRLAMTHTLNNLGVLLVARDRLGEAGETFERSRTAWEELGNKSGLAYSLNNLAAVKHLSGDLAGSQALHELALAMRRETGEKLGRATSLRNLADVLIDLGDLDQAEGLLERALELAAEIGDRSARAQTLEGQGRLRLERGALDEARAAQTEALALRRELGESRRVTDGRVALARLALEAGDAAAAESESLAAILACQREARGSEEARATAVLALALLAQDRLEESRDAAARAQQLAAESPQPAVALAAGIAAARVQAAGGELDGAVESLLAIEEDSRKSGHLLVELEARLARAQAELLAGREDEGRARLRTVADEAAARGLGLLLEKAARLVQPTASGLARAAAHVRADLRDLRVAS